MLNYLIFRVYMFFKRRKTLHLQKVMREKYSIANSFRFNGDNIKFYGEGQISIGAGTYIGNNSSLQSEQGQTITIGKNCSISHFFHAYTYNFEALDVISGVERDARRVRRGNVTIGDNCWIGLNVFIREGCSIGKNCVVGTGSVVVKSFPDNCIIGGNPARILKLLES